MSEYFFLIFISASCLSTIARFLALFLQLHRAPCGPVSSFMKSLLHMAPWGVCSLSPLAKQMCRKYPFLVICHRMRGLEREVPRSATVKVKGDLFVQRCRWIQPKSPQSSTPLGTARPAPGKILKPACVSIFTNTVGS